MASGADLYGLTASGLPPEMVAQLSGLTRQQAVAQALLAQSQAPLQMPDNKGALTSRVSPLEGIAKIVQAYMAKQGLDKADKGFAELVSQRQQAATGALNSYQQQRDGAPAQNIPYPQGMTSDDEGNAMPAATKEAVAGNPRAAVMQALLNPLIASSPIVTGDLKAIEKAAEPYSLRPNQQRFVGDKVVASGQPEVATVTAAGPDGRPVTQFVPKVAGAPAIPQPVKQEMVNTGATVLPVDPYAPGGPITKTVSPDTTAHVAATRRGQNMTDARQREMNGILEGQNVDMGPTADAIANYDIPLRAPPSNARPAAMANYNKLITLVKEKNPEWNAPDYDTSRAGLVKFTSGPQGNIVRSLSVVQEHGQTMRDAAAALNNGDNQLFNRASNAISAMTGNPAPTNFDAVKNIYKDEITKAVLGSAGALGDRESVDKTMSRVNSPQQLIGVMDHYDELMRGQLRGLKRQYEQTTKRKDFDRFLSDRAKAVEYGTAPSAAPTAIFDQADAILRGGK